MAELLFTDQGLQEQYRLLMRQNTGGHLDEGTWDRLTGDTVPVDERAGLFDHIVTCEHCSTIWRGVLALRSEAETQGLIAPELPALSEVEGPARSSWMRSPLVGLAIAATLVIAVAGILIMRQPAGDQAIARGSAVPEVEGLMMADNAEGVPTLVWSPLATATGYRVEVFSDDGRPVWTREIATPPVPWPADIPRTPGTYRWRVEAVIGPNVVARSRVSTLEIGR